MPTRSVLSADERELVSVARTAILATSGPGGHPRLVPICFILEGDVVLSPLDEKPKAVDDPRTLARVRDIDAQPRVALLVQRWDEDWSRLAWVRLHGMASVLEPGDPEHGAALVPLRSKYPQYVTQAIDRRPMIRVGLDRASSWAARRPRDPR
jgi:PPOX class probable F420-dependent enzyme